MILREDTSFALFNYLARVELCTLLSRLEGREVNLESVNGVIDSILDSVAFSVEEL